MAEPAAEHLSSAPEQCWCCDTVDEPALMIHLGNHPEVALCRGCGRWAAQQAWELDDRSRTGALVVARGRVRRIRRTVVERGWHRHRVVGRPLQWLGKRLP